MNSASITATIQDAYGNSATRAGDITITPSQQQRQRHQGLQNDRRHNPGHVHDHRRVELGQLPLLRRNNRHLQPHAQQQRQLAHIEQPERAQLHDQRGSGEQAGLHLRDEQRDRRRELGVDHRNHARRLRQQRTRAGSITITPPALRARAPPPKRSRRPAAQPRRRSLSRPGRARSASSTTTKQPAAYNDHAQQQRQLAHIEQPQRARLHDQRGSGEQAGLHLRDEQRDRRRELGVDHRHHARRLRQQRYTRRQHRSPPAPSSGTKAFKDDRRHHPGDVHYHGRVELGQLPTTTRQPADHNLTQQQRQH